MILVFLLKMMFHVNFVFYYGCIWALLDYDHILFLGLLIYFYTLLSVIPSFASFCGFDTQEVDTQQRTQVWSLDGISLTKLSILLLTDVQQNMFSKGCYLFFLKCHQIQIIVTLRCMRTLANRYFCSFFCYFRKIAFMLSATFILSDWSACL